MTIFQTRLEEALRMADMTPAELSRKTGISPSVISYYRHGTNEPKSKQLYAIATALNVSPSWLMGYDIPENGSELDSALSALWQSLNDSQKRQALDYIRFLAVSQKSGT